MNETPTPENQFPQAQPRTVRVAAPTVKPYATYVIIGFTVLVFLLQMAGQYMSGLHPIIILGISYDPITGLGIKYNALIRAGQIWRLITPVFLHGSLLHIGFNMYALFLYGRGLEARYGHGRFVLLYFLSAYAGNVLSFLLTPAPSLGASTAIFGLISAEAVFILQNRELLGKQVSRALTNLFIVAAANLLIGFSASIIDNWGHIGGLLGGLIFAWFGGPRWKVQGVYPSLQLVDEREGHGALLGSVMVLLFFIPLTALGWFWIVK